MTEGDPSDQDLIEAVRHGSRAAFSELWQRHSRAALTVARSFSSLDPDDVVSEAFANVFTAIRNGKGPASSFRAYLFTTVRNVAASQGSASRTVNLDELESLTTGSSTEDHALESIDRDAAAKAFADLPPRWQEVLWYTEVEGMAPRHAAKFLGMKPNAVAALALRAREGLRQAWIQTHLTTRVDDPECARTIERLPAYVRGTISGRTAEPVRRHLETCASCQEAAREVRSLSSSLALTLLAVILGVGAAAAYIESLPVSAAAAGSTTPSIRSPRASLRPKSNAATMTNALPLVGVGVGVLVLAGAGLATTLVMASLTVPGSAVTDAAAGATSPISPPAEVSPAPTPPPIAIPTPSAGPETSTPDSEPDATPPRPEPEDTASRDPHGEAGTAPEVAASPDPPTPAAASPAPTPPPPAPTPPPLPDASPSPTPTPPASPEPVDSPRSPASPELTLADGPARVFPMLAGRALPDAQITVSAAPIEESGATHDSAAELPEWHVVADGDGNWSVTLEGLRPGRFTVTATQLVLDRPPSAASTPFVVTLDEPPTLQLTEPIAGFGTRLEISGVPDASIRLSVGLWTSPRLLLDHSGRWAAILPIDRIAADLVVRYVEGQRVGAPGRPAPGPTLAE